MSLFSNFDLLIKDSDFSLSPSGPLRLPNATHSFSITDIWFVGELTNAAGSSGDFHALRDALNKRIQDNCFNTKSTFDFVTDETFSSSLLNYLLQTLSTLNRGVTRKNAFDSLITCLCKL
ncbi:hypothetical protein S83_039753 [Arachis hypogaea]